MEQPTSERLEHAPLSDAAQVVLLGMFLDTPIGNKVGEAIMTCPPKARELLCAATEVYKATQGGKSEIIDNILDACVAGGDAAHVAAIMGVSYLNHQAELLFLRFAKEAGLPAHPLVIDDDLGNLIQRLHQYAQSSGQPPEINGKKVEAEVSDGVAIEMATGGLDRVGRQRKVATDVGGTALRRGPGRPKKVASGTAAPPKSKDKKPKRATFADHEPTGDELADAAELEKDLLAGIEEMHGFGDDDGAEAKPAPQEEVDELDRWDYDAHLTDPVRWYLATATKRPLLTAEQEVLYAKHIEAGLYAEELLTQAQEAGQQLDALYERDLQRIQREGDQARTILIESNVRLVISIARRYMGRGMDLLDLIQEGNLGMMHAVEKFDYTRGYKFSTYSTWWIKQAMTRAIADKSRVVRVPVHMIEQLNRLKRVERDLTTELGRVPTPQEIADEMDITPKVLADYRIWGRQTLSLDQKLGDEDGLVLGDVIPDPAPSQHEVVSSRLMREILEEVLATFSEREAAVIRDRFGLIDGRARTLDEIGARWGVTRERIRQIEARTLSKMRHPSRSWRLYDLDQGQD